MTQKWGRGTIILCFTANLVPLLRPFHWYFRMREMLQMMATLINLTADFVNTIPTKYWSLISLLPTIQIFMNGWWCWGGVFGDVCCQSREHNALQ